MARILLIDDDSLLRGAVRQMLALDGHSVEEAADGDVALARVREGLAVDLVITDMLMPVMDGAQLIVELRRLHPHWPIIAVSGGRRSLSPRFSLDTAEIAGANHLLAKPFGRAQLQAAVQSALSP